MAKTSKSPKRILQVAHQIGKQRLRTYSHKFSPKMFTLPQLFACLVLKEFLRLDYRLFRTPVAMASTLCCIQLDLPETSTSMVTFAVSHRRETIFNNSHHSPLFNVSASAAWHTLNLRKPGVCSLPSRMRLGLGCRWWARGLQPRLPGYA